MPYVAREEREAVSNGGRGDERICEAKTRLPAPHSQFAREFSVLDIYREDCEPAEEGFRLEALPLGLATR